MDSNVTFILFNNIWVYNRWLLG